MEPTPRTMTRRTFTRVPLKMAVIIDDEAPIVGQSANLSLNGIFVDTDRSYDEGSVHSVSIQLGEGESALEIGGNARVARVTDSGVAFQLVDIDIDDFAHLRRLVFLNAEDPDAVEEEFQKNPGIKPAG